MAERADLCYLQPMLEKALDKICAITGAGAAVAAAPATVPVAIFAGSVATVAAAGSLLGLIQKKRQADFTTQFNEARQTIEDNYRTWVRNGASKTSETDVNSALVSIAEVMEQLSIDAQDFVDANLNGKILAENILKRAAQTHEGFKPDKAETELARNTLKAIIEGSFSALRSQALFHEEIRTWVDEAILGQ